MHRFRPLASYRYDTALVSADKLASPPASPRVEELVQDLEMGFYLYQMSFRDVSGSARLQEGLFGVLQLEVETPNENDLDPDSVIPSARSHILVHEQTIGSGNEDGADNVNPQLVRPGAGPVWAMAVRSSLNIGKIPRTEQLVSVMDSSGTVHELWQITDEQELIRIQEAVDGSQLVIADGHHRISRAMKRLANSPEGSRVTLLTFITDLDTLQAEIRPIHRCFKTRLERHEVLERLCRQFDVEPYVEGDISDFQTRDSLMLVIKDQFYKVKPSSRNTHSNDAVLAQVISRLLEARSTQYIVEIKKLTTKVANDPTKIGIVTRPLTINQIRLAAFSKKPLPPKSTMFFPKPLPGLIFGDRLNL